MINYSRRFLKITGKIFIVPTLLGLSISCSIASQRPSNPLQGKFVDSKGLILNEISFLRDLRGKSVILLGEEHTSESHHNFQNQVINHLMVEFGSIDVGFELAPKNFQSEFDKVMSGSAEVADLFELIDWKKTWGYDFELYRPLFSSALGKSKNLNGRIFALDAPKKLVSAVNKSSLKGLSQAMGSMLPTKLIHHSPEFKKWFLEKLKKLHGGKNYPHFENMYESWIVRNSTMAEQVYLNKRGGVPFVVIVGNGHIEGNSSLVESLYEYFHPQQVVSLFQMPVPDSADVSEVKKFSDPGTSLFKTKGDWLRFTE